MTLIARLFLLSLVTTVTLDAQQANDFTGTWTMDATRSASAAPGQAARVFRATQVIATRGTRLDVETVRDGEQRMARFALQESLPPQPVGTSGEMGAGTIVKWDGWELTTSTPMQINGAAVTVFEKRTLSGNRREMHVETSVRVEHGYEGKGVTTSEPIKDVYVRSGQ